MNNDRNRIVVSQTSCNICEDDAIEVYHQGFPELTVRGASAEQAVKRLLKQFESSLDAVSDPFHRDPVLKAISDARAFLRWEHTPSSAIDL